MSPTLLELIVAILLVWVAWQIGVVIAPRVFAAVVAFWRNPRPLNPEIWPPEKNVTPPGRAPRKTPTDP